MIGKVNGKKKALKAGLVSLLVLILVFSIGSMIFIRNLYNENFPRYDEPKYSGYLHYSDVTGYDRTTVKFKSGENTLTGYIYGPENMKGLVVIAPGRGEGTEKYLPQTLYFVDNGWRVFTFDYTGSYESEGKSSIGLPQSRIDLEAALAFIESDDRLTGLPNMLFGHSWGGYAVASILNDHEEISAVASISGFNSPLGLLMEQVEKEMGAFAYLEYPFGWAYQTLLFGSKAWATAVDGINRTDTPVMIIHGDADDSISYNGASIIAQRGKITNPNVVYKTRSAKNRNGHKDLFRSEAAAEYINQKNQESKALYDRYQGQIPDSVLAEFYAGVDRFKTSDLDANFMNEMNSFFESALPDSVQ